MLYLVKIFYAFIIPPGGIISLLILFNIYLYWKKFKGKYILTVITLLFYLLSTNFIAYHLVKPLENFYQNKTIEQLKQDKDDVIIMLGGGAINVADIDGEGQVSGYVANRMITVMRLQKELDIPIILSGGKVFEDTGREADIEKRIFEGMGVNSQALILENQSRNTVENVQNSKVIMEEKKNLLTYAGLKKLEEELHDLKVVKRKEVAEKIKEAREQGDLSENAEYDAAKDEQRDIEARIEEIEKILKNAEVVVEDEVDLDRINVGCKVKVHDYEFEEDIELKIVGSTEANSLEGKISNESPVGKALMGAHTGDVVEVEMPSGIMKYKVLEIQRNI